MKLLTQFRVNLGINGIQSDTDDKPGPKLWMFRNFLWNSGLTRKSKLLHKVHDKMTERVMSKMGKRVPTTEMIMREIQERKN